MFLCFVPGRGSSRPWAWWGWLDGWAYLWAISAPLAVPAPSTRASGLGERPGPAAVGRGAPQVGPKTREWRTTPAATKKRSAAFPLGMANALRPGLGSNSSQPRKAGWIPQGGGRPLLWRFFGGFLIAEKATLRSKPRLASLYPAPQGDAQIPPRLCVTLLYKIPLDTVRMWRYNVHHNEPKADEACGKRPGSAYRRSDTLRFPGTRGEDCTWM